MVDISGQPELAAVHACGGKKNKTAKTTRIVKVGGGGKSGNFQCLMNRLYRNCSEKSIQKFLNFSVENQSKIQNFWEF